MGLDVQARDSNNHYNNGPVHQCLGPEAIDLIPILCRFKSFSNTEAVSAVHLDSAEVERDAHSTEYEPQANEKDGSFCVYGFHIAFYARLISISIAFRPTNRMMSPSEIDVLSSRHWADSLGVLCLIFRAFSVLRKGIPR